MLLAVLLTLHSWLRWVVLATMLLAGARAASGWRSKRTWTDTDASIGRAWVGAVDAQVSVGFVLYFIASPMAAIARQSFGAAWSDDALRFFGILHPLLMLSAAVVTHASWTWARRTEDGHERFRRLGVGVLVTLVIVLLAVPWPFLAYGRPLVRI